MEYNEIMECIIKLAESIIERAKILSSRSTENFKHVYFHESIICGCTERIQHGIDIIRKQRDLTDYTNKIHYTDKIVESKIKT